MFYGGADNGDEASYTNVFGLSSRKVLNAVREDRLIKIPVDIQDC